MGRPLKIRKDFSNITLPLFTKLIPLTKDMYALVDTEDYERVSRYNWSAARGGGKNTWYAYTRIGNEVLALHKFIFQEGRSKDIVDHIDGNGLNNRKCNLRKTSKSQNAMNGKSHSDSISKYKGVSWFVRDSKWKAQIYYNKKNRHIGYFETEEEAAKAYDKKAKEVFGEFAYLNFKN